MAAYVIAGRVDFGGFRVAIGWKHHEDVRAFTTATSTSTSSRSLDGDLIDIGARYSFGANAVSLGYRTGEMEAEKSAVGDEEEDAFMASYRRTLGPGVNWTANLIWADVQDDGTTGKSNDGWAISSSIRLIF
jgi:predicted porin